MCVCVCVSRVILFLCSFEGLIRGCGQHGLYVKKQKCVVMYNYLS